MIVSRPINYFLDAKDRLDANKSIDESSDCGDTNSYVRVFNLVGNMSGRWGEDNLKRVLMAALLLKLLKETGYFPEGATTFEMAFVGSLLLR
jgi:hypothetical protein